MAYAAGDLKPDPELDPEINDTPPNGGKIALFTICTALVLGAVFYGLSKVPEKRPDLSGNYGICSVSDRTDYLTMQCRNNADFFAAISEFAMKNPGYKIESISIDIKKK